MANGYGMTPRLTQVVFEASLTGGELSFSTVCASLHVNGSPGSDGTSNPAAETNRLQIVPAVTGINVALASIGPAWTITAVAGEKLSALGLWNGFETDPDSWCMYTLPVPNIEVAYGDVVTLNSLLMAAAGLAA